MLRFTIRDVLWLTLVVGLAVGWWVDRRGLAERCVVADFSYEMLIADYRTLEAKHGRVLKRFGDLARQYQELGVQP